MYIINYKITYFKISLKSISPLLVFDVEWIQNFPLIDAHKANQEEEKEKRENKQADKFQERFKKGNFTIFSS